MAINAIDRDLIHGKLVRMLDRCKQRRDGAYKCGYRDACQDAIQKLNECDDIENTAVVRCRICRHATERYSTMPYCTIHNRHRGPEDFCNFGEMDENKFE